MVNTDPFDFAKYVLAKYGGSIGAEKDNLRYDILCKTLERQCIREKGAQYSVRIYLLTYAGDQIKPYTDIDCDLKVKCYLYAGASCRARVIQYLPKLLQSSDFSWVSNPTEYKDQLTYDLAKTYFSEGMYYKAAELYEKLYNVYPDKSHYAQGLILCLIRMETLDVALSFLEKVKSTELYQLTGKQYRAMVEKRNKELRKQQFAKFGIQPSLNQLFREYLQNQQHRMAPINQFKKKIDYSEMLIAAAIVSAREHADYQWIADNLPDMCPKSFSGYKRMKTQKTKNFQKLVTVCNQMGKNLLYEDGYNRLANELSKMERR